MNEHRNASNQLTFAFDSISSWSYKKVTKSVVKYFNLQSAGKLTVGLDEKFQEFKSGDSIVGLEWDNWSGYTIDAKNKEAEPLLREIASYINENYQ